MLAPASILTALRMGKVMTALRKLLARNQQKVPRVHMAPHSMAGDGSPGY